MYIKPIRLSRKKDGHGNVSSYSVNIGAKEARECGFLSEDGEQSALEKVVDPDSRCVIIRIKAAD